MENKIETLAELKGEEVRLRNELESKDYFTMKTVNDYSRVHRKLKELESWLLWTIVSLILILIIGGCNTARSTLNLGKSIGQDGAWILGKMSDNIQTQEK